MNRERFEELVIRALETLPEEFSDRLENVDVVVEDWPTQEQLESSGLKEGASLLGLYEGIPITNRGTNYGMVTPDKITIFRGPLEVMCRSDDTMTAEIQRVVRHEIAHHFGIGDARLSELEGDEGE